jgi:hypothetical protein
MFDGIDTPRCWIFLGVFQTNQNHFLEANLVRYPIIKINISENSGRFNDFSIFLEVTIN